MSRLVMEVALHLTLCVSSIWWFWSCILYKKKFKKGFNYKCSVFLCSVSHCSKLLNVTGEESELNLQLAGQKYRFPGDIWDLQVASEMGAVLWDLVS